MPRAKILTIILLVLVIILLIRLFPRANSPALAPVSTFSLPQTLTIKNAVIKVEIASTPTEQTHGLSGRPSLAPDAGMLFVYQSEVVPLFWMKEMHFPLDIIWLDKNKKVVGIERQLSPATYPATYHPTQLIRSVLEVNAGFAAKYQLEIGDKVLYN